VKGTKKGKIGGELDLGGKACKKNEGGGRKVGKVAEKEKGQERGCVQTDGGGRPKKDRGSPVISGTNEK